MAVAAVVVALATAGFLATRNLGDDAAPEGVGPAPSESPSEVVEPDDGSGVDDLGSLVEWEPLDPRRPAIPAFEPAWEPDPGRRPNRPGCQVGELDATSSVRRQPGGGLLLDVVLAARTAQTRCRMMLNPGVFLYAGGQPVDVVVKPPRGRGAWPGFPAVGEDERAVLTLGWEFYCGADLTNDEVVLQWGGVRLSVDGFGEPPPCDEASGRSSVSVSTFQPERWSRVRGAPVLRPVQLRQIGFNPGGDGIPASFLVELLATGPDVSLRYCPDIRFSQLHGPEDVAVQDYALNCEGVRHRDRGGEPFLPQGEPVQFVLQPMLEDLADPVTLTLLAPEPVTIGLDLG